jgi:hypothetical protein
VVAHDEGQVRHRAGEDTTAHGLLRLRVDAHARPGLARQATVEGREAPFRDDDGPVNAPAALAANPAYSSLCFSRIGTTI